MANQHVIHLLDELERKANHKADLSQVTFPIDKEDMIRIEALCDVFDMEVDELIPALLHTVLQEVEASLPYRQGNKVIRVEDGDPIYEDIGPTPRYLAIKRKLEAGLKSA
ncbi:MAG: hypothetical protein ACPGF7_04285 [Pontibacterium sp.]